MLRRYVILFIVFGFIGCDRNPGGIVLPSRPFTEEEKRQIVQGDAEICNSCGDAGSRLPQSEK